jgi:hypothetical protein
MMNNMLKEFEKLLVDNACPRCKIKPWETKFQTEGMVANSSRIH